MTLEQAEIDWVSKEILRRYDQYCFHDPISPAVYHTYDCVRMQNGEIQHRHHFSLHTGYGLPEDERDAVISFWFEKSLPSQRADRPVVTYLVAHPNWSPMRRYEMQIEDASGTINGQMHSTFVFNTEEQRLQAVESAASMMYVVFKYLRHHKFNNLQDFRAQLEFCLNQLI